MIIPRPTNESGLLNQKEIKKFQILCRYLGFQDEEDSLVSLLHSFVPISEHLQADKHLSTIRAWFTKHLLTVYCTLD